MATNLELIEGYKKALAKAEANNDQPSIRHYRRLLKTFNKFQTMEDGCREIINNTAQRHVDMVATAKQKKKQLLDDFHHESQEIILDRNTKLQAIDKRANEDLDRIITKSRYQR